MSGYAFQAQCEELLKIIRAKKRCCCRCEFFVPTEPMTIESNVFGSFTVYDGSCQRYPPYSDPEDLTFVYPAVGDRDWCGEFIEGSPLLIDDVCARLE